MVRRVRRCILERLSNQPVQPSAPAGAGHPTRRQTAGKEAAPGRYPHRTGDFIRYCIKIHRLQVRACNRCFCVSEDVHSRTPSTDFLPRIWKVFPTPFRKTLQGVGCHGGGACSGKTTRKPVQRNCPFPCRYQIPRKILVLGCWGLFGVQSQSISS